jgi:hypothetical protein
VVVQEVLEHKQAKVLGLLDKVSLTLAKPPSEGNLEHANVMLQRVAICTQEIERLMAMEIKLMKDELRFMEMLLNN